MTRMMFGPLVLLAASVTPLPPASAPATQAMSNFRPSARATATATVSIRVISGVRFGSELLEGGEGADRRKAQIRDADGLFQSAELLEFQ